MVPGQYKETCSQPFNKKYYIPIIKIKSPMKINTPLYRSLTIKGQFVGTASEFFFAKLTPIGWPLGAIAHIQYDSANICPASRRGRHAKAWQIRCCSSVDSFFQLFCCSSFFFVRSNPQPWPDPTGAARGGFSRRNLCIFSGWICRWRRGFLYAKPQLLRCCVSLVVIEINWNEEGAEALAW